MGHKLRAYPAAEVENTRTEFVNPMVYCWHHARFYPAYTLPSQAHVVKQGQGLLNQIQQQIKWAPFSYRNIKYIFLGPSLWGLVNGILTNGAIISVFCCWTHSSRLSLQLSSLSLLWSLFGSLAVPFTFCLPSAVRLPYCAAPGSARLPGIGDSCTHRQNHISWDARRSTSAVTGQSGT